MRHATSSIVLSALGVVLLTPLAPALLRAQSPVPATASPQAAAEQSFGDWLAGFRSEALSKGIRAETLDLALAGIEPLSIVL